MLDAGYWMQDEVVAKSLNDFGCVKWFKVTQLDSTEIPFWT